MFPQEKTFPPPRAKVKIGLFPYCYFCLVGVNSAFTVSVALGGSLLCRSQIKLLALSRLCFTSCAYHSHHGIDSRGPGLSRYLQEERWLSSYLLPKVWVFTSVLTSIDYFIFFFLPLLLFAFTKIFFDPWGAIIKLNQKVKEFSKD